MQEDLIETGHLIFKSAKEPTLDTVLKSGITEAVVVYYDKIKFLRYEAIKDDKGQPKETICIRDNPNAKLLLQNELISGTDACRVCANFMICTTKNSTRSFILNN
jgi:hypothetical protein